MSSGTNAPSDLLSVAQTGSSGALASVLNCDAALSQDVCCIAAAVLSSEAEELATAAVVHKSSAAAEAAYHIAATPFKVPSFACPCCSYKMTHRQEVRTRTFPVMFH